METKKYCPYCGEEILAIAKKCKHCGEWLNTENNVTQKKSLVCPYCAEEIEEGLEVCPLCDEPLKRNEEVHMSQARKENHIEEKPKKKSKIKRIWYVVTIIFAIGLPILAKTDILDKPIDMLADIIFASLDDDRDIQLSSSAKTLDSVSYAIGVFEAYSTLDHIQSSQLEEIDHDYLFMGFESILSDNDSVKIHTKQWATEIINRHFEKNKQDANNQKVAGIWKTMSNQFITNTSIAGVEVIGKTVREIKPLLNPALIWDDNGYVKNGETTLFYFLESSEGIYFVDIYDPSLTTAEGICIGSTAGDILKVFPNATAILIEGEEYTYINGISYIYDYEKTGLAGTYNEKGYNEDSPTLESKIINKNAKIHCIRVCGMSFESE